MALNTSSKDLKERIDYLEKQALDRGKAEAALRKAEERFRTLTTLAPVGIFMTDSAGRCLFVNERCCEIAGLSPEEAMGDGWINALHPEDRERVAREWDKSARSGTPFNMEYRFKTSEGRITWVSGRARAVYDSRGKVMEYIGTVSDISDLKRAEVKLKESEKHLRQIIDLVPHMIFAKDRKGRFLLVNDALTKAYGTTVEKLTGASQADYHPDNAELARFLKDDREVIENGRSKIIEEETFLDAAGRRRILQAIKIPYRQPGSTELTVLGVAIDITEIKRTEQALRDREAHLRAILDSVLDGIITIDEDGIIETFNRAAEQIFGYHAEEVIGQNVKILMTEPHRSRHDDYVKNYIKTGTAKIIGIGREVPGLRKNGQEFPLDLVVNEMWEKGQRKFIAALRDITKRRKAEDALKESERQLSTLMGNLQGMAYRCLNNKDWTMKFVSEGSFQLTGYQPADLIDSRTVSYNNLIHPADRKYIWETIQAAVAKKQPFHIQYRIWTASGEEKWVSEQGVGVFSDKGDLLVLEGLVTDVSNLVHTQEALRELNEELENRVKARTAQLQEANQALEESLADLKQAQEHLVQSEKMAALGELVAGVAHEINTPVGIGVTAASHLEQKTKKLKELFTDRKMKRSDFEKYLNTALESSASMLTNLNRAADLIRSFKQVAVDQTSEERRRFRLKEYIDKVLLSLRPKYKRTHHTITINCPEDLEICSYPGAFSQIITNLVINSLIHGFENIEEGSIVLNASVEDNQLLLQYCDDGGGMDAEHVKKIFDPFFTSKRVPESTGLGMYIVYNLVTRLLNGRIECHSAPDQGTEFVIQIPIQEENVDG